MYIPPHFNQPETDALHALIAAHPLATLVTHSSRGGLEANHIPLLLKQDGSAYGKLVGHVARANLLAAGSPDEVLAIFHGPDCYISPGWYATKKESGKVVPTWNFVVVHAYGNLRVIDEPDWIMNQLDELTLAREQAMPQPWRVGDAPEDFTARSAATIVGVEISISRLLGKWKVSQNQPEDNQRSVMAALQSAGTDDARLMAELIKDNSGMS